MECLYIDFEGYIKVDKNDIVLNDINSKNFDIVDVKKLSSKEIIDGIKNGIYLINFDETRKNTLDGEEHFHVEIDLDD